MADPYSVRADLPVGERPTGAPPWLDLVAARGGMRYGQASEAGAEGAAPDFWFVASADPGPLPPLARLDGPYADLIQVLEGGPQGAGGRSDERPILMLRHGLIGGPSGAEGAVEAESRLIDAALDLALGDCDWERDPDFDWEIPVPGVELETAVAEALCPRLLFARHDRVYEYAERVVEVLTRWHRTLSEEGGPGADVGRLPWPPEPTSDAWKD